jgi:hypothetical protein
MLSAIIVVPRDITKPIAKKSKICFICKSENHLVESCLVKDHLLYLQE